jgi:TrmH family RNA methyltransferase
MHISKNKFLELKKFFVKKVAEKERVFLVEGLKNVKEALLSDYTIRSLFILEKYLQDDNYQEILDLAEDKNIEINWFGQREADHLSELSSSPGLLLVIERKKVELVDGDILILDKINDPGNLGTIIRNAEWFGIKNIVLSENSVNKYNSKVVRSTMGAFFKVNILENVYLPKFLKNFGSDKNIIFADVHEEGIRPRDLNSEMENNKNIVSNFMNS